MVLEASYACSHATTTLSGAKLRAPTPLSRIHQGRFLLQGYRPDLLLPEADQIAVVDGKYQGCASVYGEGKSYQDMLREIYTQSVGSRIGCSVTRPASASRIVRLTRSISSSSDMGTIQASSGSNSMR